jgi:hypothetical protein
LSVFESRGDPFGKLFVFECRGEPFGKIPARADEARWVKKVSSAPNGVSLKELREEDDKG